MFHLVYITTNLINGKQYIGKHSTKDPNDGYLGSGLYLCSAVEKYGRENFVRTDIFCGLTEHDAYELEAALVTDEVVNSKEFYNLKAGGVYGPNGLESRAKASATLKGRPRPTESIEKQRATMLGKPRTDKARNSISLAKRSLYLFVKPSGEWVWWFDELNRFCEAHSISHDKIRRNLGKGVISAPTRKDASPSVINTTGWSAFKC
ncbi:hypothetical protein pf16_118 [Pseudomonas phage pf16]|uniref:GIY-YIG domain-containing protein n=1 Tax=Pseudomonas phage pf16 TaxID=1815630 RepID=A0A1S5R3Q4_9CAUD|nr:homing endonuclease [Pseudomonas phage pf16]AND75041.1 hypothetical protein pf16_118 [Pseudomonas phage pf16]